MEYYPNCYETLQNNRYNTGKFDYVPLHVWSTVIKNRLITLYHGAPQQMDDHTNDSIEMINKKIDYIVADEHLEKKRLVNWVTESVLIFILNALEKDTRNVPKKLIPQVYNTITMEIKKTRIHKNPNWLATLSMIATQAEAGLHINPSPSFSSASSPALFQLPSQLTPAGIQAFCQGILSIRSFGTNGVIQQVSSANKFKTCYSIAKD